MLKMVWKCKRHRIEQGWETNTLTIRLCREIEIRMTYKDVMTDATGGRELKLKVDPQLICDLGTKVT